MNYTINDAGHFYRIAKEYKQIYVPNKSQEYVMSKLHDGFLAGYSGWEETLRTMQENFYWAYMPSDVRAYIQSCRICACTKRRPYQSKVPQMPRQPQKPGEVISIDIMGPYGNRYILAVTDLFIRWSETLVVPVANSQATVRFLHQLFQQYGYLKVILSDNGNQFLSILFENACSGWGVEQWTITLEATQ